MISSNKIKGSVNYIKKVIKPENSSHIWQFSRVGGVNRVNLEKGVDIVSLEHLDQKLWTALSCPTHGLEIDSKTLDLIDKDQDQRIRVPEIIEAVNWITSVIKNPDDLIRENKTLTLSAINENTEEGKKLLISAKQILINIGKPDSQEISVEETSDTDKIFANTKFNGDGIITEDSSENTKEKELINNIISTVGFKIDRNGKNGISIDQITDFYQNCEDYSNWYLKAESDLQKYLPFGDKTNDAFIVLNSIKSKIDDYFIRCRLTEFDSSSTNILNSLDEKFEIFSKKDLTTCIDEIATLPLLKIEANKPLPLTKRINPAWENAFNNFKEIVIKPIFPKIEFLTETDWEIIKKKFENYSQWQNEKTGTTVEQLGLAYIREIIADDSKNNLIALIDKDKALESEADYFFQVDRLVRYYRDLFTLLRNFVTFYDFYLPNSKAIFQAGSLYIDQRCCDLCIKVSDMSKHLTLAASSGICLIYCDCYSKSLNQKMTILAALTDGDIDNMAVGRNAVFYDRKGNDWDATIIKIIENPISIRQAFWSPYRKVSKFINTQIEKVAAEKDKEITSVATTHIEQHSEKVEKGLTESIKSSTPAPAATTPPPPATPPAPFDIGKFVGIFAAFSLALGAIGSVVVSVLTGFFGLEWWKMPLAIIGIILTISGPSMILAWLKLRKRNLAPILDANGWAINARATINIPFGTTLTHIASLPTNAKLNLTDPFSKKKKPFLPILIISFLVLLVITYILWHYGYLNEWGIVKFRLK
ncbi:MAG: hypothetical protein HY951_06850 [Bacteroidia bacterium]|nr:hypothetical protein [Bacteroidia bacterium]